MGKGRLYFNQKLRKWCAGCDDWLTTRDNFESTKPAKDGFNRLCITCEPLEKKGKKK